MCGVDGMNVTELVVFIIYFVFMVGIGIYFFAKSKGDNEKDYFLVNTSGRVVDKKGRSRDGNDYYFVTGNNGQIQAIYLEN